MSDAAVPVVELELSVPVEELEHSVLVEDPEHSAPVVELGLSVLVFKNNPLECLEHQVEPQQFLLTILTQISILI